MAAGQHDQPEELLYVSISRGSQLGHVQLTIALYSEYLKRDDQYLAYRTQNEDARNRMVQQARDKDRALAGVMTETGDDVTMDDLDNTPMPEAAGSKLIVIHPGSQSLRIGLGTDALPKTVPMCIARKWKANESEDGDGEPTPKRIKIDDEIPEEHEKWFGEDFAKEFSIMSSELKVRMRNNKRKLLPNSKELVLNYNRRARYEEISEHNDPNRIEWTEIPKDPKEAPDFVTGQEALRIPEESNPRYKLFWPIRHGWFNEKDYTTKTQLCNDIAVIIEQAVKSQLGLSEKELPQYSCVFIIPDLYERVYVTTILHLLIRDLGFSRVCFQQESLAATFGAGYSNGCIVDIGHQKTSVCCVDEGLCIEDSRLNIKMGGDDVTTTFLKMMLTTYFPYWEINLLRRYDLLLAEELKHRFCTMQEQEITVQTWEFYLRASGQSTRKYTFRTYDEPMLSALVCLMCSGGLADANTHYRATSNR
jgi:actin-related protein 8